MRTSVLLTGLVSTTATAPVDVVKTHMFVRKWGGHQFIQFYGQMHYCD